MKLTVIFATLLHLILLGCTPPSNESNVLQYTLNGAWKFYSPDTLSIMPAEVPGTVHTDLMDNNIIGDPYYRTNEKNQQWVDKKDWIYETTFSVPENLFKKDHLELNFEGLDTYAEVILNDQIILKADNFFRSWQVSVKSLLKAEDNQLRIKFTSPTEKGMELLDAWGYALPAVNDQSENGEMGENKVSVFTRKPGYHYGWDWGPRLVTTGIWKDVYVKGWNDINIQEVYYQQLEVSDSLAKLNVSIKVLSDRAKEAVIQIQLDDHMQSITTEFVKGINNFNIPIEINSPKLWWSHELGDPYLYDGNISIKSGSKVIAEQDDKVGLRSIRLVQEPDQEGKSFVFELNGIPVFAKGANYIPQDLFLPRVTDKQYEGIISSAKAANMNMLRVWGGGIYEKDIFYDLCDQEGILVWQDFMFACSMYPNSKNLLENIRLEAEENVKKLRNHASLALWCGNNEIDVAWQQYKPNGGWGWKQLYTPEQRAVIWQAYDTIFNQILPAAVLTFDPQTDYWPSSPMAGPTEHSSYESTSGDVHYWGVWHGLHPFEAFSENIGRFMSEYGFQSFPEFNTVKKFTISEDWDIESEVMAAHQRSGIGNLRIRQYMEQYYRLPDNFEDMLYVGQVLQGEGMRMGFEAHRRAMPYNMGSLYWQINDCWPVASWAGMDYYQNWKAMHYMAKKAFEPIAVSPTLEEKIIKISVISDKIDSIPAVLDLKAIDFSGNPVWSDQRNIVIKPLTADIQYEINLDKVLKEAQYDKSLLMVKVMTENQEILCENNLYFLKTKDLQLPTSIIDVSVVQQDGQWLVNLQSDQLVKNLWLQFENIEGRFSDNYFDLIPGKAYALTFETSSDAALTIDLLKMKSIRDTY